MPAGKVVCPARDVVFGAIEAVAVAHAGGDGFFAVKEEEFDLAAAPGLLLREAAGDFKEGGGGAGSVVGSDEVGDAAFGVDVAAEQQGAGAGRFVAVCGAQVGEWESVRAAEVVSLGLPACFLQLLFKVAELLFVGGAAAGSRAEGAEGAAVFVGALPGVVAFAQAARDGGRGPAFVVAVAQKGERKQGDEVPGEVPGEVAVHGVPGQLRWAELMPQSCRMRSSSSLPL